VDAVGTVIRDFIYSNTMPWPSSAGDGTGFSLVLNAPLVNPDHADPFSWRSSVALNGSPGADDSIPFTGNPDDDLDNDGYSAFLEYALGTDDGEGSSVPGVQLGSELVPDAGDHLTISFSINLAAVGLQYSLETSGDLSNWTPAISTPHISTVNQGDGTAIMTFRSDSPAAELPPHSYYRIKVTGQP
jgi:hypothetical protein